VTTTLRAAQGSAFKQAMVLTTLGTEWKQLSDVEKATYVAAAAADKRRFDTAVASNPENKKFQTSTKRKGRKGPTKLSAYLHFCAERRPSITAELKASMGTAFKNPAVLKALGAEWKCLDESSKARFKIMAEALVSRETATSE